MTLFDLIALLVIAVSALLGFQRGAIREFVGLFAFGVSAAAALLLLPITSSFTAEFFHQHLVAVAVAVVAGFAVVYILFKWIGLWIAHQVRQQSVLGGADRALGLGIGALRALILLGLFALVFDRATPAALKPGWITGAFTYPLASASGRALGALAPAALRVLGHPSALLNGKKGPDTQSPDTQPTDESGPAATVPPRPTPPRPHAPRHDRGKGYDQRSRDQLNTLLERTR